MPKTLDIQAMPTIGTIPSLRRQHHVDIAFNEIASHITHQNFVPSHFKTEASAANTHNSLTATILIYLSPVQKADLSASHGDSATVLWRRDIDLDANATKNIILQAGPVTDQQIPGLTVCSDAANPAYSTIQLGYERWALLQIRSCVSRGSGQDLSE
jgi:hypothetical protein